MAVPSYQLCSVGTPLGALDGLENVPDGGQKLPRALARFSLEGKVCVVTGGAGALGFEACRALCDHGARAIAILDIKEESGGKAADSLKHMYPEVDFIFRQVNIQDDESVQQMMDSVLHQFGRLDVLLCFAGMVGCVKAEEQTMTHFRKLVDVNLAGTFCCAQAAAQHMIKSGNGGSIVLIGSISAHGVNFPQPQVAYNAAKSGIVHAAKSMAAEWSRYKIRVNSISPGYMDTMLNEGPDLDEFRPQWYSRTPMGRMGGREELNGAVILLASGAGSYITGSDLLVDGGISTLL